MGFRIGVDCGGTFTDGISVDDQGLVTVAKSRSTPEDFTVGTMEVLTRLAEKNNLSLEEFLGETGLIIHGTTQGTNIIVTRNGAKVGLITTEGYRDILELRRILKDDMYNWRMNCPRPLVPRSLRVGVEERLDFTGRVKVPLNEESAREAVAYLKKEGVEAIVVVFLYSFLNPEHEKRVAEIIRKDFPEAYVSLSSTVLPAIGEFERTSTMVINAYIAPSVSRYIDRARHTLEEKNFKGQFLLMQNNGGVETTELAVEKPATLALSGPAAAPIAAKIVGGLHNEKNLISVDMGGTSFDCGIIYQDNFLTKNESMISDVRFAMPIVDITGIGAGGGSIANFDVANTLHVGPQSAGASPGPACYDAGGEEATVTDADVVLGYVSPDFFLGGEMRLRKDLAEKAIKEKVADRLGLSVLEGASAIYKVINSVMADSISFMFTERGYDPRDFTLCAGGAAGPVHAARIMRELGISRLLIPKFAPIYCAFGMLGVDLKHDFSRFYYSQDNALDLDHVKKLYREMESEAVETLKREGISKDHQDMERYMELRYYGQYREIEVPWPGGPITKDTIAKGISNFHAKHRELYGYSDDKYPLEFMCFKLTAIGRIPRIELNEIERGEEDASHALKGEREAFFEENNALRETPVYDGDRLRSGNILKGPCIVEEMMTTIVIPPEIEMTVDRYGNYISR